MLNIYSKEYQFNNEISCGDKSITHRALILASISSGIVRITNGSTCDDCLSTANCLRSLGATITQQGTTYIVEPITSANDNVTLDCGNSGTTARLMLGLVAGLGISATFVGDKSLSRRPMDRVVDPIRQMGCVITTEPNCLFATHGGSLVGINYNMPVASAQVKSAILIAGLMAKGETKVTDSYSTRNHTELMLEYLSANVTCEGNQISVTNSKLTAKDIAVPQDMSSLIFPIALACFDKPMTATNVGINATRMGAINALMAGGADIAITNQRVVCNDLVGDISARPSKIHNIVICKQSIASCIDELPLLAVVMAMTSGQSSINGAGELKHKESNRINAISQLVTAMGASCTVDGDSICISGGSNVKPLNVITNGDHRTAMSAIVAGLLQSGVSLDNYSCVSVSCPNFFELMGIKYYSIALLGGSNIASSLSPVIYQRNCIAMGSNGSYQLVAIDNASDSQLLDIISSYDGLNVTMPYKSTVAKLLGGDNDIINTVFDNGKATNTDPIGFTLACQHYGVDLSKRSCLIIGAGDTGCALAKHIVSLGGSAMVVNRTESKAAAINNVLPICSMPFDTIISCVPPCQYELDAISGIDLTHVDVVFSLSYKQTSYLAAAFEGKAKFIDGKAMLYYQAQYSFKCWHNAMPGDNFDAFKENN